MLPAIVVDATANETAEVDVESHRSRETELETHAGLDAKVPVAVLRAVVAVSIIRRVRARPAETAEQSVLLGKPNNVEAVAAHRETRPPQWSCA